MYEVMLRTNDTVDVYLPVNKTEWKMITVHATYRSVYGYNCCIVTVNGRKFDSWNGENYTGIVDFNFYGHNVRVYATIEDDNMFEYVIAME